MKRHMTRKSKSLLSLVPLSCMVVPIRNLVNIVMASTRGKIPDSSKNSSREVSISSTMLSKPYHKRVIKTSPKFDIAIIWIDIWDTQSKKNSKMIINRCFNVGKHIATIWGANMNSDVLQYKNCWKWEHSIFVCRIQGSKCTKCNGLHKSEHHHQFAWCCKVNFKTNSPRLETKQGKPCSYSFKCSNCKGDYQVNSNLCPFWKHRFNRK